jgi:hypothetical protein
MATSSGGVTTPGVPCSVITRHLAGLQRFQLLGRHERVEFLLTLFVDLPNLLLPLLRAERRIGANGFDFRARPLLDGAPLPHGRLRYASHFPARWLMGLR